MLHIPLSPHVDFFFDVIFPEVVFFLLEILLKIGSTPLPDPVECQMSVRADSDDPR
jgi:hypothetical protein